MKNNIWLNGIMGVIVGDALGLPAQFKDRSVFKKNPVTDMEGYGTFGLPAGSWSDDGSLTMATFVSLNEKHAIDCEDIMGRFVEWLYEGKYTPFGEAFDEGLTCTRAIGNFWNGDSVETCGMRGEFANGNGALMRILPVCLLAYEKENAGEWTKDEAIAAIHKVSALTHNHLRSQMACGIYYFLMENILDGEGDLLERMQKGMDMAAAYYGESVEALGQLEHFQRLFYMEEFRNVAEEHIKSGGYVIDSIEAAVWCLLNTDNFRECLLKAVNLGDDTDTTAAIAGGLAGVFYGYESMPEEWLEKMQRRGWIEEMCVTKKEKMSRFCVKLGGKGVEMEG